MAKDDTFRTRESMDEMQILAIKIKRLEINVENLRESFAEWRDI